MHLLGREWEREREREREREIQRDRDGERATADVRITIFVYTSLLAGLKGKRGNVNLKWTIQPKWELNQGPLDLKISTLLNELKRYPTSTELVVVLVNPIHYIPPPLKKSSP